MLVFGVDFLEKGREMWFTPLPTSPFHFQRGNGKRERGEGEGEVVVSLCFYTEYFGLFLPITSLPVTPYSTIFNIITVVHSVHTASRFGHRTWFSRSSWFSSGSVHHSCHI